LVSSQRKPTAHSSSQTYLCQEGVSNTNSNSDLTLGDLPTGIPATCKVVQSDNTIDGANIISGTYAHPDLIPSIAGCISVDFALKVSEVINGYIVYEYKHKLHDMEVQLEITAANEQHRKEQVNALNEIVTIRMSSSMIRITSSMVRIILLMLRCVEVVVKIILTGHV
jgi:hypothetical protein